ncbi:MAG: hypothetical protein ACQETH_01975 [Candidatus Rifleibacteriota bacterium]
MVFHELKIEVSPELLKSLKEASEKENISEQQLAKQLLEKGLANKSKQNESKPAFPGVALIKDNFAPPSEVSVPRGTQNSQTEPEKDYSYNVSSKPFKNSPSLSPEQRKRKETLEEQMREISLLIDTAESEEKKEKYLQVYAGLAAEMEALL